MGRALHQKNTSSLIRVHITQQIKHPENDLFDSLMATDRLGNILPTDLRTKRSAVDDHCKRAQAITA